jgi:hypothetical protein
MSSDEWTERLVKALRDLRAKDRGAKKAREGWPSSKEVARLRGIRGATTLTIAKTGPNRAERRRQARGKA